MTEQFQRKKGLPHCIGAIDGTHIPIKAPYDNPEQYVSRKKFHSVQLQGVCDADRFFTDVYSAYPGSVHDSKLTREQRQFNYFLSSTRMKIEHTFGLLKGRFRKLKVMMDIDQVEDIPLIVTSACVLHNFCLLNEDNIDMCLDSEIEQEVNNFQNIFVEQENAKRKRAEIMQLVV